MPSHTVVAFIPAARSLFVPAVSRRARPVENTGNNIRTYRPFYARGTHLHMYAGSYVVDVRRMSECPTACATDFL